MSAHHEDAFLLEAALILKAAKPWKTFKRQSNLEALKTIRLAKRRFYEVFAHLFFIDSFLAFVKLQIPHL